MTKLGYAHRKEHAKICGLLDLLAGKISFSVCSICQKKIEYRRRDCQIVKTRYTFLCTKCSAQRMETLEEGDPWPPSCWECPRCKNEREILMEECFDQEGKKTGEAVYEYER